MPALDGYPQITPVVTVADVDGDYPNIVVKGTYDSEGKLVLTGGFLQTYIVTLPTPATEDVTLHFEPIISNIPAEKVVISATKAVIPVGAVATEVTVGVVNDDMSFIESDLSAQEYVLGLKITGVTGANMQVPASEAKVTLKKDAYVATCTVVGAGNNQAAFNRYYWDGVVYNDAGMTYTFKVKLDRLARKDLKLTFTTEGLAPQFQSTMTFTPSDIVIPAGSFESEEITWALTDDLLMTSATPEEHTIVLTAVVECEDPTVVLAEEEAGMLTFNINKLVQPTLLSPQIDASWLQLPTAGWVATGGGGITYGSPASVLDGDTNSSVDGAAFWVAFDMLETKKVVGIAARYYASYYCAKQVEIFTSEDGATWTSVGVVDIPTRSNPQVFKVLGVGLSSRYVKYEILKSQSDSTWLGELEFYTSAD